MSVRTSRRITAVAGPFVAAALVLAACGGGTPEAESRPTIELAAGETSFETLAPATTVPDTAADADSAENTPASTSSEYVVQSGDYPFSVANQFDTSLEELAALNGWVTCSASSCGEFPFPGESIRVPGSASADSGTNTDDAPATDAGDAEAAPPAAADDTTDDTTDDTSDAEPEGETGEAIPETSGDRCEPGSYPIEAGDFEGSVADKFDVTLDELRAANAQTTDYNVFYVGLEIVIPPASDC